MRTCKKCGRPVLVLPTGDTVRPCGHVTAPIVVSCSAKLRGVSKVN